MKRVVGRRLCLLVGSFAGAAALWGGVLPGSASAVTSLDIGWTEPAVTVGGTGSVSFTPQWDCQASNCLVSGRGATSFTVTALNGATFAPQVGLTLRTNAGAFATCTVSETSIDCSSSVAGFFIPRLTPLRTLAPVTLNLPAAVIDGTPVAELTWSDSVERRNNNPANDRRQIVLANGPFGNWGHPRTRTEQVPGVRTGSLDLVCRSVWCSYDATDRLTVTSSGGARLLDPAGASRHLAIAAVAAGTCTVLSATSLSCAPDASGLAAEGARMTVPQVAYEIPAEAANGTQVAEIAWARGGPSVDDPADDRQTVHVSVDGAYAPQNPTLAFGEGFEHNQGATPIVVTDYQGPPPLGQRYTADPAWLTDCNGILASELNPLGSLLLAVSNCGQTGPRPDGYFRQVTGLAWALGTLDTTVVDVEPAVNHAVAAFTNVAPDPGLVQLETVSDIPVEPGRFYAGGVTAATTSCDVAPPLLRFTLIDGGVATSVTDRHADPCASPDLILTSPAGDTAWTARFASDRPLLARGAGLRLQLFNDETTRSGNDGAVDNFQLLDVTPQLSKSFTPATVEPGKPTAIGFTITNTTDLYAKAGWAFTDRLAEGLTADPASVQSDCSGATVDVSPDGRTVAVRDGRLDAGQVGCTITVRAVSAATGTFRNCASNLTGLLGVQEPRVCSSFTAAYPPPPAPQDPPAQPSSPAPVTTPPIARPATVAKARLRVATSVDRSRFRTGESPTLTLRVRNRSGRVARDARTCAVLPAGLVAVGSRPTVRFVAGRPCWTAKRIRAGATVTYRLRVRALRGSEGRLVSRAVVSGPTVVTARAERALRILPARLRAGGVTG